MLALPMAHLAATALATAGGGFSPAVTNPWFPARPGMRWEYRGHDGRAASRDVVRVLRRAARIDGAPCVAVRDLVFLDGRLRERTTDFYTQDRAGTVWYFGENTAELDRRGRVVSREGSWRAGVSGALPGIVMPAHPRVGQSFRQEFLRGHAEDHFKVVALHATIAVPSATFRRRALMTEESTPLEPGVLDRKWYVRGIGDVAEKTVRGGSEQLALVAFRRGR